MPRELFYIVRIDHRIVPAILEYVSDDNRRFTSYREGAEMYTSKRKAIAEARRLTRLPIWPGQWKVIGATTRRTVFDSAAGD